MTTIAKIRLCLLLLLAAVTASANDARQPLYSLPGHAAVAQRLHSFPDMIVELFAAIEKLSDYARPNSFPRVSQVARAEFERSACGGACRLIKAAYIPEKGVYLDNRLDPENDLMDRSILLHELVHYAQAKSGRYAHLDDCERRRQEEVEAYEIQNAYLASNGHRPAFRVPAHAFRCAQEPAPISN